MKFTILYQNKEETRRKVLDAILEAKSRGYDIDQHGCINAPFFSMSREWLSTKELFNLPINVQCEELELENGEFKTLRKNTIDVEAEIAPPICESTNLQTSS